MAGDEFRVPRGASRAGGCATGPEGGGEALLRSRLRLQASGIAARDVRQREFVVVRVRRRGVAHLRGAGLPGARPPARRHPREQLACVSRAARRATASSRGWTTATAARGASTWSIRGTIDWNSLQNCHLKRRPGATPSDRPRRRRRAGRTRGPRSVGRDRSASLAPAREGRRAPAAWRENALTAEPGSNGPNRWAPRGPFEHPPDGDRSPGIWRAPYPQCSESVDDPRLSAVLWQAAAGRTQQRESSGRLRVIYAAG